MSYKARYFPISARPLTMAAGLHRFGADFGQGARDQQYFQLDEERPRYLADKRRAPLERRVFGTHARDASGATALAAALAWMRATLAREAPDVLRDCEQDRAAADELDALARNLQEDFCVLEAGESYAGRAALIDVRFPSGWRPERLRDASFERIHAPVPGFPGSALAASSMVQAMVERGPFVRFVWTLCPVDRLDQHPERRSSWDQAAGVWLRVERQISVPLPAARASLFLIRVYHYALAQLSEAQRARTLDALAQMPEPIRAYKGLPSPTRLAALLDTSSQSERAHDQL